MRYSISVLRVGAIEITGNTKTHDDVIRRELRLRPGMVVTDAALRSDYNRLNNLGFFEKIDFQVEARPRSQASRRSSRSTGRSKNSAPVPRPSAPATPAASPAPA